MLRKVVSLTTDEEICRYCIDMFQCQQPSIKARLQLTNTSYWNDYNLGFLGYHFDSCHVNSLDGKAIAKRFCTQITKATGAIKQLVKEYTRQNVDAVGCKYPSTIAVEDALSIDSPLWRELNDDIQPQSAVPYCLKRQLIDLFHTRKRCLEEIANTRRNGSDVQSFRGKVEGIGHLDVLPSRVTLR